MHKSAMIHTRIEPPLKVEAEAILEQVGLTSSDAIRLLYKQICLNHGLPFAVKLPNKITQKAMHDVDNGNVKKAKNVDELFKDL